MNLLYRKKNFNRIIIVIKNNNKDTIKRDVIPLSFHMFRDIKVDNR